uniref:Uncharacterized protein n=1 Tax=viral metagenome TaxID=1070528 RepID=A0A6C0BWG3_9ZZZZ
MDNQFLSQKQLRQLKSYTLNMFPVKDVSEIKK